MVFYVYILYSEKYGKSYVGLTQDLDRRLLEHNAKKSTFTSKYTPWIILYYEHYQGKNAARNREKYLKSAAGRRWMKENIKWPRGATE